MDLRKLNWIIIKTLNKIFQTSIFDEIYWKFRSCKGDWGKGTEYLDSINHSHRKAILDEVSEFDRGFSLLEVGCNSGPNLLKILEKHPYTRLAGIDINRKAVERGQRTGLDLKVGRADKLPYKDREFDIVLVDAVLMYIGPDKIRKVISEIGRMAKKKIIIIDFHKEGVPAEGEVILGHWVRDYKKLLGNQTRIRKLTKEEWDSYSWNKLGHLIVYEK